MTDINKSNWHIAARQALDEGCPAKAEQTARENAVGWGVNVINPAVVDTKRGLLVDVRPFKANNGGWYLSIYVLLDGTESHSNHFTAPNGKKCTLIGELQHLKP